tara:strand:+ start:506 stop:670 length:165 start_codon:yes stop_codon:yes gene_type:complete
MSEKKSDDKNIIIQPSYPSAGRPLTPEEQKFVQENMRKHRELRNKVKEEQSEKK